MSRGHWNYSNEYLKNDIFGYDDKYIVGKSNVFEDEEISELIFDVFGLIYLFDSYICGDTCEGTWLEDKEKFKEKWFGKTEAERVRKIIDETFAQNKKDIMKAFYLYDKCGECKFGKPEGERRVYCEKNRWSPSANEPACDDYKAV